MVSQTLLFPGALYSWCCRYVATTFCRRCHCARINSHNLVRKSVVVHQRCRTQFNKLLIQSEHNQHLVRSWNLRYGRQSHGLCVACSNCTLQLYATIALCRSNYRAVELLVYIVDAFTASDHVRSMYASSFEPLEAAGDSNMV